MLFVSSYHSEARPATCLSVISSLFSETIGSGFVTVVSWVAPPGRITIFFFGGHAFSFEFVSSCYFFLLIDLSFVAVLPFSAFLFLFFYSFFATKSSSDMFSQVIVSWMCERSKLMNSSGVGYLFVVVNHLSSSFSPSSFLLSAASTLRFSPLSVSIIL